MSPLRTIHLEPVVLVVEVHLEVTMAVAKVAPLHSPLFPLMTVHHVRFALSKGILPSNAK